MMHQIQYHSPERKGTLKDVHKRKLEWNASSSMGKAYIMDVWIQDKEKHS